MNVAYILLIVFGVISSATSDLIIPEQDYKLLPPIFHIDAYDQCLGKGNTFCKVSLKLSPSSTTSKSWKIISETKKSREHYNHDELYHAICMDEKYNVHKNVTVLEKAISKLYTQKYKHLDLKATVIDLNCHNYQYHLKMFDVVLMSFIVAYLLLIVFATVYDVTALRKTNKCITSFSLYHNLTELKRKYQQTDFHKLKCIQGIRFYTTVLIIFCHTFCSFSGGFVANTKYFEEIPQNSLRHGLRNLFVFLVQTFFLISAWLLSYHTFHIFEHAERMHFLKYVWLTFGNRYLRIIPPVLLMVSLGSSIWIYGSFHGPVKDIYSDKEYQRCQENWWIIFLFLNNHYQQHDMCYFTTWYLSADTQLYALSIIILIIIFKLKYSNILLLAICVTIGVTIPSTVSYLYNLDFIYRITPDNGQYLAVYDYNDRSKKYCVLARRDFSTFLHTRIISWYTLTFPSDHHFDLTANNTTPYFNKNKSKYVLSRPSKSERFFLIV
ncbi:unnamed protein product [Tenebrio molitor]|nr:unnamed protein product [Tenebrio molitor]